jgi:hypothetical protein
MYWFAISLQHPALEHNIKTAIAIMTAIVFAAIGHVWPWYLVLVLAFSALLPGWWLSRFVVGVATIAPFTLAFWWVDSLVRHQDVAALIMYVGAILWPLSTRRASTSAKSAIVPYGHARRRV